MAIALNHYLALALLIFMAGVFGVLFRRDLIMMLMSIELMLNAVNIVFVAASQNYNQVDGQIMVFFIMTVAACEAAVGLAMVIALYRKYGTVMTDFLRTLRG